MTSKNLIGQGLRDVSEEKQISVAVFCETCGKTVLPKMNVDMENPIVDSSVLRDAISEHGELVHDRARRAHIEICISILDSGNQS